MYLPLQWNKDFEDWFKIKDFESARGVDLEYDVAKGCVGNEAWRRKGNTLYKREYVYN